MSSTCSGLGKCSSEHSTCSFRFCQYVKFLFSIKMYLVIHSTDQLLSVVQCDNVLLWSLFRLDISLQWGALCQLLTQVRAKQRQGQGQGQGQNRGTYVNYLSIVDLLLTVLFLFSASRLEILKRLLFAFSILMSLYFVFQRPHRDSWLHLQHICDRLLGS